MTKLVGISGKRGSGKTTTARHVADAMNRKGIRTTVKSFATPLKEDVIRLFNAPREIVYGSDEDKATMSPYGITWRELLQRYGEARRQNDPDAWVRPAMRGNDLWHCVIFDDLRHPNEAAAMNHTVRLTRWNGVYDGHVSEIALDAFPFDFTLHNHSMTLSDATYLLSYHLERWYAANL